MPIRFNERVSRSLEDPGQILDEARALCAAGSPLRAALQALRAGRGFRNQDELNSAIGAYRLAARWSNGTPEIYAVLGDAHESFGDHAAASDAYARGALRLGPRDAELAYLLWTRVALLDPCAAQARVELAELELNWGGLSAAERWFSEALSLMRRSEDPRTLTVGRRAQRLFPKNRAIALELARVWLAQGRAAEALQTLSEHFAAAPPDEILVRKLVSWAESHTEVGASRMVLIAAARSYLEVGRDPAARADCSRILEAYDEDPDGATEEMDRTALEAEFARLADDPATRKVSAMVVDLVVAESAKVA